MLLTAHEEKERQALVEYVCAVYKIDALTSLMERQLEQYFMKYKFKFKGMLMTLQYCFSYTDRPMEPRVEQGLAPIPYFYDEAKQFYLAQRALKSQMQDVDAASVTGLSRTVNINQSDMPNDSHSGRKIIEIDQLGVDD